VEAAAAAVVAVSGRTSERPERVTQIAMRSERRAIPAAVDTILAAVRPVGLPSDRIHDLAVALSEALSNAAIHGNGLDPNREVQITVKVVPRRRAQIEVKDDGYGFDHGRLSDPTHPEQLLAPSGRGVFLMRRLVDQVDYEDGGSLVRLTVGRVRS
jgi:serine/threonine-protein kinase RsbW